MSVLTKTEISAAVSQQLEVPHTTAKMFVDSFFEEIRLHLESNQDVKLSSFGNFETRDKKARPGRNPKTGKEVEISSRRVVTFHSGQKLKQAVHEKLAK